MGIPPRPWAWLALAGAAWSGLGAAAPPGSGDESCGARVEHFELRATAEGPAIGFASLHRRQADGETQLEWQVQFPDDELDAWHVETLAPGRAHCLWRERTALQARTVVAERRGAEIELLEWGRPAAWRERITAPESCAFPLELGEGLREGTVEAGEVVRFDPLANALEILRVEPRTELDSGGLPLRTFDVVRADGSLAASWTFAGRELARFRWQRGGLVAVRTGERRLAPRTVATGAAGLEAPGERRARNGAAPARIQDVGSR